MPTTHFSDDSVDSQALLKSTDETIAAVKAAAGDSLLIVDLDETLFLRNSSQAYLDCIYPRVLGLVLLLAIKAVKPWRLLPAPFNQNGVVRDWFLIVAATILFPWTWFVWRSRAKALASTYCNMKVAKVIDESKADFVIATRGFSWVVNPLIRHLPMSSIQNKSYEVIACRFWLGVLDRAKSKLEMVQTKFGEDAVATSTVVTDSAVDQQLLGASAVPCLAVWPEAAFTPALSDVSLPFLRYVKGLRSDERSPESSV